MKQVLSVLVFVGLAASISAVPRYDRPRHGLVVRGNPSIDKQCPPNNEYWHAVPDANDCCESNTQNLINL
jgi:hypothetical protein